MSEVSITRPVACSQKVAPRLDDFFTAVQDSNPFVANRVTEPSMFDVDVPEIHAAAFDRLTGLARQTLKTRTGIGATLLGGAGVGKSHLLSRLYRWANATAEGGGPRACYVYLHNILADPDRFLGTCLSMSSAVSRKVVVGHCIQRRSIASSNCAILCGIKAKGAKADDGKAVHEAFREYFAMSPGGADTIEVLYQFLRHARPEKAANASRRHLALEAVAWLSGDEVDPDVARSLGLRSRGQEVMLRDDQEIAQVLLTLAQFAILSNQPFILCIDQVDNLDPDKLQALAQFLHALIDHAANLLVITSGVKLSLLKFKEESVIAEATWDRISRYTVDLHRVVGHEAHKILEARLERFLEPFLGISGVKQRIQDDSLFPLGRAWLEKQLGDGIDFRPRDVLTWASEAWESERARINLLGQGEWIKGWPGADPRAPSTTKPEPVMHVTQDVRTSIDNAVDSKIKERIALHRLQPGSLPPDAGNLAGLVDALLGQCVGKDLPYTLRGVERNKKKAGRLPPYDLLIREQRDGDGRELRTGMVFVTNSGLSATAALRRLLEDTRPPDHRLLVTDQERRPLKVGAQGIEYYRDLEKLGPGKFQHLKINFEQYAGLDALLDVVGMARSGDLEIESPPRNSSPDQ